ncbi:LacI family DNA-binding transcriptional regulator [Catenulispora rubra]|uniref:LacI family DNA-binding transcriptional regulator n=1 Tax=Catenulispora rubra TaxID=280293 RepID=UPI0018927669|nr:LacI family DNA-binding transcriptional regulator [Catenulispora rubra]
MTRKTRSAPPTPATIRDVAAQAGVSASAVSLAVHNRPGVSAATRERILAVADELGWRPNQAAASLSGRQLHTVGLVIARPARMLGLEPFYMEFISGIESVLVTRNCGLLLQLVDTDDGEIAIQREWWRSGRVNGSIMVDLKIDDPRIPALAGMGLPAVVVGDPALAGPFTAVWTDDTAAVREAVRYLAVLGHRRIARVSGPETLGHSVIRTRAMQQAGAELELDEVRVVATDYSGEDGARATRTLLTSPSRPTAIIFDNDVMAVAAVSVAAEMGLSVPHDVSLLAWDDSQLCQLTRPMLSAMSHDVCSFGAEAARTLLAVLDKQPAASHPVATPVLVPRGTTAPPAR